MKYPFQIELLDHFTLIDGTYQETKFWKNGSEKLCDLLYLPRQILKPKYNHTSISFLLTYA